MHLNYFKSELEKLKNELEKQIDNLTKYSNESLKESVGELSGYDNHPADLGAETFEREKDQGLKGNAKLLLMKVNHALDRINSGTYGRCERCGKIIEEERLKALPYTTFCVDCKKSEERPGDHSKRPIEEELLNFPFGRSFLDGTGEIEYDGEDAWQDVARYGTSDGPQDVPNEAAYYNETYVDSDEKRGIVEKIDNIIDEEDPDEDDKNEFGK